jgi:hypothetical protein
MTTRETQYELYQALVAHKFELDNIRGVSALDQEILDRRIEDVQRLLEWVSQASDLEPTASPSSSNAAVINYGAQVWDGSAA